jgi:hypothetical protein
MTLSFIIAGLLVALCFPALCQLYGLIAGIWTMFSWIPLISGYGSHVGVYSMEFHPVIPFTIINVPLSRFWIGWGLLVAAKKRRAWLGFILGGSNVFAGTLGLFYWQLSTGLTLGTGMLGLVLTSLVLFFYGTTVVSTIFSGWSKDLEV